jgi:hypothetical protein
MDGSVGPYPRHPFRGEENTMTTSVAGEYKDGKIELLETPTGLREGHVQVILIQDGPKPAPRYLEFGKYKGDTPPEAFKEAEWHGEEEFDDLYGA